MILGGHFENYGRKRNLVEYNISNHWPNADAQANKLDEKIINECNPEIYKTC